MTNKFFEQVDTIIQKDIKSFIEADGGRIKLLRVEEGVVYVKLSGACTHCPGASITLKGGVEKILQLQLPEVKEVRLAAN
jgi:Fe-S cluster biogenesis protein NfuA